MKQTFLIIISGKVQGVFFRKHTKQVARELGLTGFVKNQSDGTVLIETSGSQEQVDKLVNWCKQGPEGARVTSVEVNPIEPREFAGFSIH